MRRRRSWVSLLTDVCATISIATRFADPHFLLVVRIVKPYVSARGKEVFEFFKFSMDLGIKALTYVGKKCSTRS